MRLTFALELQRAECEFLTGAAGGSGNALGEAFTARRRHRRTERPSRACALMCTRLSIGADGAIAVGLDYLRRHLGIDWSPHPTDEEVQREYARIWSQLGSRTIEELIDLPLDGRPSFPRDAGYSDEARGIRMAYRRESCVHGDLPSGQSQPRARQQRRFLLPLCIAWLYRWAALRRLSRPDIDSVELGCQLVEKHELKRFQARTYKDFAAHVIPWTRHVRSGREILRRALEIANQSGDLTFAGYSYVSLNSNLLAAGDPLD